MRPSSLLPSLMAIVAAASPATGQFSYQTMLSSSYVPGTNIFAHRGIMFDLIASVDVTVCGFDLNLSTGTRTLQLYQLTNPGSFVGNETNPAAWTLVATLPPVTSLAQGNGAASTVPTPLPLPGFALPIPAGTTRGVYITETPLPLNGGIIVVDTNLPVGAPATSNGELAISTCKIVYQSFVAVSSASRMLGACYYQMGLVSVCNLPPPPVEFQLNQAASSLTLDNGSEPSAAAPVQVVGAVYASHSLGLSSNLVGSPWDIAVRPGSAVGLSAGGIGTAGGQTINLDVATPGLVFVTGGPTPNLASTAFPGAPVSVPFMMVSPAVVSAQMIVLDPTRLDGYALSHAGEAIANPCPLPEGFEGPGVGGAFLPPGWQNASGGGNWYVTWQAQTSLGGGTIPGPNLGARYIYGTPPPPGPFFPASVAFRTCPFPVGLAPTQTLVFWAHRDAATGCTLTVEQTDATGAFSIPMGNFSGPSTTGWSPYQLPFVATGPSVAFRFVVAGSSLGIVGLDDIFLL